VLRQVLETRGSDAKRPVAVVLIEACGSALHWGHQIAALEHQVVLLPPHHESFVLREPSGVYEAHLRAQKPAAKAGNQLRAQSIQWIRR
jgi:hypothetical protein